MQQICFDFAQFSNYLLDKLTTHDRLVPKLSNCETLHQPRRQVPIKSPLLFKVLKMKNQIVLTVVKTTANEHLKGSQSAEHGNILRIPLGMKCGVQTHHNKSFVARLVFLKWLIRHR